MCLHMQRGPKDKERLVLPFAEVLGHLLQHQRSLVERHAPECWPADASCVVGHGSEVESFGARLRDWFTGDGVDEGRGRTRASHPLVGGVVLQTRFVMFHAVKFRRSSLAAARLVSRSHGAVCVRLAGHPVLQRPLLRFADPSPLAAGGPANQ